MSIGPKHRRGLAPVGRAEAALDSVSASVPPAPSGCSSCGQGGRWRSKGRDYFPRPFGCVGRTSYCRLDYLALACAVSRRDRWVIDPRTSPRGPIERAEQRLARARNREAFLRLLRTEIAPHTLRVQQHVARVRAYLSRFIQFSGLR